jgi:hypothetical protein
MAHPSPEAAYWAAEIPTAAPVPEKYGSDRPHVVLAESPGGDFDFDIVLGPSQPCEPRSRDSVRVPYVGNDPIQGIAHGVVAVRDISETGLEIADPAREHLAELWKDEGVTAAFFDEDTAREYGAVALVEVAEGQVAYLSEHGSRRKKYAYTVTSSGLVLASLRTVVQSIYAGRQPAQRV